MGDEVYLFASAEVGLGFTSLRRESAIHCVAQLLTDRHQYLKIPFHYAWTPNDLQASQVL
eukprot:4861108-Amphidinium_carterae.6